MRSDTTGGTTQSMVDAKLCRKALWPNSWVRGYRSRDGPVLIEGSELIIPLQIELLRSRASTEQTCRKLVLSTSFQIDALAGLLVEKGILGHAELERRIEELRSKAEATVASEPIV